MYSNNSTTITFDDSSKIKKWHPPGGIYRASFMEVDRDGLGRTVLKFQITSLMDPVHEYWARHGYREADRWKLNEHLHNWLGRAQYSEFMRLGGVQLDQFYGCEADIVVGLIDTGKPELLRVIEDIRPAGSLLPSVELVGEFQI
jgi:hypothetical protein